MESEWVVAAAAEYCDTVFDGTHDSPKSKEEGHYLITTKHLMPGRIDFETAYRISDDDYQSVIKRSAVSQWDVLISMIGTIGTLYLEANSRPNYAIKNIGVFSCKDEIKAKWLYHYLRTPKAQHHIHAISRGTTQQYIPLNALRDFPIDNPPREIKKNVTRVLGALDDRIELNRRMNETLEAMAQALFKSWFVDFDPVIDNALASGKEIPAELSDRAAARAALGDKRQPLPAEIRTLFPDEFTASAELGWIPEGWDVKTIDKILKTVSETYPLKSVDQVVFLNTGDILNGNFLHKNYSDTSGLPGQAKKSIMKDDILYSEIRPKNRRFAYVYFESPEYVVSTKLMVLRAISNIKSIFAYFILKQETCIDYLQIMAESRSGTFPQITFDVLSTINVALPDKHAIIDYFTDDVLERTFQKSIKNDSNSMTLSKLRDTLLPKLLSGEVRISEPEKMMEELAL